MVVSMEGGNPSNGQKYSFRATAHYVVVPDRIYLIEGHGTRLDFVKTGSQFEELELLDQGHSRSKLLRCGTGLVIFSSILIVLMFRLGGVFEALAGVFLLLGIWMVIQGLSPRKKEQDRKAHDFSIDLQEILRAQFFLQKRKLRLHLTNGSKINLTLCDIPDLMTVRRELLPLLGSRIQETV